MLPSGGGIRVAEAFCRKLAERFEIEVHSPAGGSEIRDMHTVRYPFRMWMRPKGLLAPLTPFFLPVRLLSFQYLCRRIAHNIDSRCQAVLVHNTMPIAAPPLLKYLESPSLYFCFEYPRHIYQRSIIRRTANPVWDSALAPLRWLEKGMDMEAALSASGIAVLSSYMSTLVKEVYGRDSRVIRPGVDTEFFTPAGDTREYPGFVLSVGALWPFKGHETAIEALSHIRPARRPRLVITGDRELPGYSTRLREKAAEMQVDLLLKRSVSDLELRGLYRKAAAVLCCQKSEPYGLVPLEAMACGTPVIAILEGGFTDNISDGETGLFFNGDPISAAEAVETLLCDKALRSGLSSRALDFVRNHRNSLSGIRELATMLEEI